MPDVEIELSEELWHAIDENRGTLSRDAFIELAMKEMLNLKAIKINRKQILRGQKI